jgi:hypothetical protein
MITGFLKPPITNKISTQLLGTKVLKLLIRKLPNGHDPESFQSNAHLQTQSLQILLSVMPLSLQSDHFSLHFTHLF